MKISSKKKSFITSTIPNIIATIFTIFNDLFDEKILSRDNHLKIHLHDQPLLKKQGEICKIN